MNARLSSLDMTGITHLAGRLLDSGFALAPDAVDKRTIEKLIGEFESIREEPNAQGGSRCRPGLRNILHIPIVSELVESDHIRSLIERALGASAKAVRGIFFDKTPDSNWKVAWHQDLSIAVERRVDLEGFGPWSVKKGVVHVQPPVSVLRKMITLRLHLDNCGPENGPLRVIPGSHAEGILDDAGIAALRRSGTEEICCAGAGDALLMSPLLLHSSSAAVAPRHRRVVHVEFAAVELPGGLRWHRYA
jgi:hypothetical protein